MDLVVRFSPLNNRMTTPTAAATIENDIRQVCHWDVFQIVFHFSFHVGSLAITRGTRTVRRPGRYIGMTHRSLREDRGSLQLLEIERQSEMRPPPACQRYTQSDASDCRYPQRRHT
jgi:hypothetical protein